MPQHQFVKGAFQTFRSITKIHLGALSDNLLEGEEIDFDGFTMRRGGQDHALHSLRGAVQAGWLVLHHAPETKYVPQPAGVVVHKSDGFSDAEINLSVSVDADAVEVGSLSSVRPDNAPAMHKAANAGEKHVQNDSEGVVVARFKTSAKQGAVQIGKDDRQVVKSLDNKTSVDVERVATATATATATGDVQEAISGDTLEDLLPNAASTGTPPPGVFNDGEQVTAASSDLGLSLIQQFIPDFGWDLKVQWAKRAKIAVEQYGKIPAVLNYILSVETDAVKAHIEKRLAN